LKAQSALNGGERGEKGGAQPSETWWKHVSLGRGSLAATSGPILKEKEGAGRVKEGGRRGEGRLKTEKHSPPLFSVPTGG